VVFDVGLHKVVAHGGAVFVGEMVFGALGGVGGGALEPADAGVGHADARCYGKGASASFLNGV
jgi:hypothetical protein